VIFWSKVQKHVAKTVQQQLVIKESDSCKEVVKKEEKTEDLKLNFSLKDATLWELFHSLLHCAIYC